MKNSIYLIVLFIFCIPKKLNGQNIEDFGKKSFNQIQTMNKYKPCDIVYNKLLLYCVENGNKIAYIFNSGILNAYQLHTYYSNQFEAKQAVKQLINDFSIKHDLKPVMYDKNGGATFTRESLGIFISFTVLNYDGDYYAVEHIAAKE